MGKNGQQAKDEGLKYLSWSLGEGNNDYLSYVRGKSNVIQVYDTRTDFIYAE